MPTTRARRARRAGLAALFVALWAILAVSCGSGEVSKEEYAKELTSSMSDVEAAYGDATNAVTDEGADSSARSIGELVSQLRTTQVAMRDAGNRLDEITPPADLATEHDDLVAGVRDMADAIDLLIEAQELSATDPKRASELARQFATDDAFETVVGAATKIRDAGVDVDL